MLNQSAADRVFDALGDPTRRALVARLSRRPMSVSDLGRPFGITLAAVVQHVQVLERSRLGDALGEQDQPTARQDEQG